MAVAVRSVRVVLNWSFHLSLSLSLSLCVCLPPRSLREEKSVQKKKAVSKLSKRAPLGVTCEGYYYSYCNTVEPACVVLQGHISGHLSLTVPSAVLYCILPRMDMLQSFVSSWHARYGGVLLAREHPCELNGDLGWLGL